MSKFGTNDIHKIAFGDSVGLQAYYGDHLIYGGNVVVPENTKLFPKSHKLSDTHGGRFKQIDGFWKVCSADEYADWCESVGIFVSTVGMKSYGLFTSDGGLFIANSSDTSSYINYIDDSYQNQNSGYVDVPAFYSCNNIKTVEVLSGAQLYKGSFYNCDYITDVSISENVYIGNEVFADCSSLINVTLPVDVSYIGYRAFENTPWLRDYVENYEGNIIYIGHVAYGYHSKGIGSLSIVDGTKSIYDSGFKNTNIIKLTIPDSVELIGRDSFRNCTYMTDASINGSIYTGAFRSCTNLANVSITSSVAIGDNAFSYCTSLSNITLPYNLEVIGSEAFSNSGIELFNISPTVTDIGSSCFMSSNLRSVKIPGGVREISSSMFANCSDLSDVIICDGITKIGNNAFLNCTSLRSIIIPSSVSSVSDTAFKGCTNLQDIYVLNTGTQMVVKYNYLQNGNWPESAILHVKDSLINTYNGNGKGYSPYFPMSKLSSISTTEMEDMPYHFADATVESICVRRFDTDGKGYITKSELNNITSIPSFSDSDIIAFTEFSLFKNVTNIQSYAFSGCKKLYTISIPDSITSIGSYAFQNSDKLHSIALTSDSSVTHVGDYAFSGTAITSIILWNVTSLGTGVFKNCSKLSRITGGLSQIKSLPDYTFQNCISWKVSSMLDYISVGKFAFDGCTNIEQFYMPSIKTIGNFAFYGCTKLRKVWIYGPIESIGNMAFYNCNSLKYFFIDALIPPTLGDTAFPTYPFNINIVVPSDSVEAYKAAPGWSVYKNSIIGYNSLPFAGYDDCPDE